MRLDSREAILKGGNSGKAVVEGKPDESLLIQAVRRTHIRLKMPPVGSLAKEEVSALEEWVRRGLPWPETQAQIANASASGVTPELAGMTPVVSGVTPELAGAPPEWPA